MCIGFSAGKEWTWGKKTFIIELRFFVRGIEIGKAKGDHYETKMVGGCVRGPDSRPGRLRRRRGVYCLWFENTSSYRNLSTGDEEAICEDCLKDAAFGSPDECSLCGDEADGFYINLLEVPVFVCQDCYDELDF